MHAFIIEDDYLIAQSLCDMLEPLGFSAFSFARSEDAAIAGAREQKFDLITADVRLIPGDGVTAAKAICKGRKTPVIFITGYAGELLDRVPDAVVSKNRFSKSRSRRQSEGFCPERKARTELARLARLPLPQKFLVLSTRVFTAKKGTIHDRTGSTRTFPHRTRREN